MSIIELDHVSKRFGDVTALDDVTVRLEENAIHGLLGRNGAGKTTLMQILTAQAFATSGRVRAFGEDPWENTSVLDRTCFIREGQRYPDAFTVRHVLAAGRISFAQWDDDLATELVDQFRLRTNQRVKKLSRGQLSAVGVVLGLASRAPLTIFDEPYLGLDAVARQLFYDRLLADFAEHPRTIVLSTHLIDEVGDLLDHVVVLDQGRVVVDEDTEALRGSLVVVSGPSAAVDDFAAGLDVVHRENLGGFTRATVRHAPTGDAERHGLRLEPVSLQQLVVRTTTGPALPPDTVIRHEEVHLS
ncbi:ABC transporter ATP-binding protein [Phycicoccus sp. Root101]|uniref:ABC transporter ATP-binding protein n=1 Tax=Phycicoccus sp. Root101 TaxID=1736421 RepID=UPI0007024840|nr:ABC transporter ATP-binding protein [Phycicoccus sp. Root101]KQU70915.1 ABC transporter ATP-binding protein [Phycicoccus sp. Root101]